MRNNIHRAVLCFLLACTLPTVVAQCTDDATFSITSGATTWTCAYISAIRRRDAILSQAARGRDNYAQSPVARALRHRLLRRCPWRRLPRPQHVRSSSSAELSMEPVLMISQCVDSPCAPCTLLATMCKAPASKARARSNFRLASSSATSAVCKSHATTWLLTRRRVARSGLGAAQVPRLFRICAPPRAGCARSARRAQGASHPATT